MVPGIGHALITEQNTTTSTSTQTQAIGQPGTTCQFPPCPPTGGQGATPLPGTLAPTLAAVSGNAPLTTAISPPAAVSGTTGPAVPGVTVSSGAPISAQSVSSSTQTTKVEQTKVTTTAPAGAVAVEEENVIPMANPVTYREMRELMIYESNLIHGECACPYSPDRIGGQCGSESKYYKPHSDKIYCYISDISNTDVHFFWLKNGIGLPDY
jgi:hypothetical protein